MKRINQAGGVACALALSLTSQADHHQPPARALAQNTVPAPVTAQPASPTTDPLALSTGSWGQHYADQWGLAAVGLTPLLRQQLADLSLQPVTVAIIDTGIDYSHPELPASVLWRNPDEKTDGQDNDGNGLIDDLIGWNFIDHNNQPWDDHGHGTHLAGVIAAKAHNGRGIAGLAPNARIMALKAVEASGYGNGSQIAAAIRYAADKGAQVIQLSLGGAAPGALERDAIRYAQAKSALIVVAAGNKAAAMGEQGYESLSGVLLVGAATPEQERAQFSDWGSQLALLAPGVDVLSLRARGSDFLHRSGDPDYQPGSAVVNMHYYRASGSSFAAPFVSAAAALLLGQRPALTPAQLTRMLTQSARDLGPDGPDMNHGYGLLNIRAALVANPDQYLDARIGHASWQPDSGLQLYGSAVADGFKAAWLEWGAGDKPEQWQALQRYDAPVNQALLATLSPAQFPAGELITLRLTTEHNNGRQRQGYFQLQMPDRTPEDSP